MKITAIELSNVRGFKVLPKTSFSNSINIFIGNNNSGKSTIINSIFLLQRRFALGKSDITLGEDEGLVMLDFVGTHPSVNMAPHYDGFLFYLSNNQATYKTDKNTTLTGDKLDIIPEKEPHNMIYPFLAKRKVDFIRSDINYENSNEVSGNLVYLQNKIDRLMNPSHSGHELYVRSCKEILGFEVYTQSIGTTGKIATYNVTDSEHIAITAMGEGVSNILGIIVDLCIAKDKIFLIEELENDMHPKALRKLLDLILTKSENNQFFITTHSNIVLKHLGGDSETNIFRVSNHMTDNVRGKMFISKMELVANTPMERKELLSELGYELLDLDLWKGWLILEESSAETCINYFIDWFFPNLKNKLKTFSARGKDKVESKFANFNSLFVFIHLQPTYKNRAWVLIDGGEDERVIIDRMKDNYSKSGWNPSNFSQLTKHNFEDYYPDYFKLDVENLSKVAPKDKKGKKEELIAKVVNWIKVTDISIVKSEFKKSAIEVINYLATLNNELA
jgi:AAA15 family ATPase/GTPase